MFVRVAIVDDEADVRSQLGEFVARFGGENALEVEVTPFPSADELLAAYDRQFDIIIFDIDMPGTSGIEAARRIRQVDSLVVMLFVTNIAQYAIDGYEVEAVDYVIKPIGYHDFALKFKRALKHVRRTADSILLESVDGPLRVYARDIPYVEVLAHYITYHTLNGDVRVRGSMREHEEFLNQHGFARSHKSYLVNLSYVEGIHGGEVAIDGGSIPLGRAYREPFMQAYLRYLQG